jgi:hypothetical protein
VRAWKYPAGQSGLPCGEAGQSRDWSRLGVGMRACLSPAAVAMQITPPYGSETSKQGFL